MLSTMSMLASTDIQPAYLKAAEELKDNPGQWQAYESTANCVVLAGPGSGKTKLLTIKMARIIHENIRVPQGIACITYSTECARELKKRLDALGIEERRNIFIGTIHGFCLNHIIRPYAKLAGYLLPDPIKVADTPLWKDMFNEAAREVGIENPIYLDSTFERYRRTYIDRNSREFWETSAEMPRLIQRFEEKLHNAGFVDFDDMMLIGLSLAQKKSWIRQALKARFPVLVIDEYQDLGVPLHHLVLELGLNAGIRLFAVGDPDQSIYGFNGAQPQLLRELAEQDSMEKVELSFNYRCAKKIVANSVIALGESRHYEAKSSESGDIYFWECHDGADQQAETICTQIIQSILDRDAKRTLGDVAVLYLDKYDAARITAAAKRHGIKYIGGDRAASYRQTPVTRWLEDCAAWCAGGWRLGKPRLSSIINFWLGLFDNTEPKLEEHHLRQKLVSYLWSHRIPERNLKEWLDGMVDLGLLIALEKAQNRTDEVESLKNLIKVVADPNKLGAFSIQSFGNLRGSPDHLNLITLHASKGLEFDVVIMMGLEQGRIPRYGIQTDEESVEERRKFYVGMTRAKREIHFVYSGWYANSRGRRFDNGPSEFVVEQGPEYFDEFQDQQQITFEN
jgi:DNA helicase-2/ATP-dependent DNA helicase PcrA